MSYARSRKNNTTNINTIATESVLNKHINISSNEMSSGYSKLLSVVVCEWSSTNIVSITFTKQGKLQNTYCNMRSLNVCVEFKIVFTRSAPLHAPRANPRPAASSFYPPSEPPPPPSLSAAPKTLY